MTKPQRPHPQRRHPAWRRPDGRNPKQRWVRPRWMRHATPAPLPTAERRRNARALAWLRELGL